MTIKKRLDVSIRSELRDYISEEAKRTEQPMNLIADQLLAQAVAHRQSERVEQQSLPVLREMVSTELVRGLARLRADLREDMQLDLLEERKTTRWKNDDQVETVLLRTLSETRVVRKMLYALVSHLVSPQFAVQVFDDAKKKKSNVVLPSSVVEEAS